MNTDIRIDIKLTRHRKFKRLKRTIGQGTMEFLILFWTTVAEQCPDGDLSKWTKDDIEAAAEWDGEPGVFCQAMIESGFLDVCEKGFYPHDWKENQPWASGAKDRSEAASKAGKASAEAKKKKKGDQREVNGPLNSVEEAFNGSSTDGQRKGNGTSTPSPSPSPLPKENLYGETLEDEKDSLIPYEKVLTHLNSSTDKNYRMSDSFKELVRARWNDGFRLDDFKSAIDNQSSAWKGTEMETYLRPATLFQKSKFDGYVNNSRPKAAKLPDYMDAY